MKNLSVVITAYVAVLGILSAYSRPVSVIAEDMPSKDSVKAIIKRVADWQIEHMDDTSHTTRVGKPPHHIRHWTHGALWVGMVKWANMADDDAYWAFLTDIANRGNWELHDRIYHADDHTVGQLYVELYRKFGGDAKFVPTMQRLDYIMQHPSKEPMWYGQHEHLERWTWCDALFMSPPVWAKMSTITGDPTYLDWMVNEYKATTDHLWDPEAHLFYRDNNFIDRRDQGRKIFWARGNGWVFAGLTLILDELEPESAYWAYFVGIYRQMAARLLELQTSDGYWAMSLLAADLYPTQETSGTSFFTFGLAWGINHGILDRDTFLPAVLKGWQSVTTAVTDDGMLGYVQPIGAEPGSAWPDKTEVYGVGAFLAAGSEVYQLAK